MKKTNFITIGIFNLCLLFSFNTFAGPVKFLKGFFDSFKDGKSIASPEKVDPPSRPTPEEIEEFSRQSRLEGLDNIDGISVRAVNHNAIVIDEQFNQTLDEILEMKGITREDIPQEILDHLRSFTLNPLKLFDPDNVLSHSIKYPRIIYGTVGKIKVSITFSTHFISNGDYNDIYRAFFQKRLDPENSTQMYHLGKLIDKLKDEIDLSREEVLGFLFKHEGFTEDAYKIWSENIFEKIYGKEVLKSLADDCFREGFDREIFFTLWKDGYFREFIINSKFMTKAHLTDRPDLLVAWSKKLNPETYGGQLSDLIISTFDKASGSPRPKQALAEDPFWKTVLKAIRDNEGFRFRVEGIVEEITPVKQDKPKPPDFF